VDAQTPDVAARSWVDRSAIFVGDRVTYTIELTCRRGADVLADDLSADKLELERLELLGSDSSRDQRADETTVYRYRYVVTTYRVDAPALKIGALAVRYYVRRPGQRPEDATPAGEVQVPGASIALRSVLPDDAEVSGIRDDRPPLSRSATFASLGVIGLGLIVVSIVPAALAAAAVVRWRRAPQKQRSARAVREGERASLEAIRAINPDTIEGRRALFTQVNALVRDHLRDACGVPGPSLTPAEVAAALSARGSRVPIELVTAVLTTCEAARYAPAERLPSAEVCRDVVARAEQVLETSA